jgi:hypothetical protein
VHPAPSDTKWSVTMTRTPLPPIIGAPVLIAVLSLAACTAVGPGGSTGASASVEPSPSASVLEPSATAAPASSEPTESLPPFACTPSVTMAATTDRATITDVRVGTHEGYDRVVFEFAAGTPQTVIEAVLPPFFQDASGLPLEVAGSAFLKVTMTGASRVSLDGVVAYDGPTSFEPGFDQLVQLIEGGDFEAVSTWYLGLNGGGCTRVLTLDDPSRLVIDIED